MKRYLILIAASTLILSGCGKTEAEEVTPPTNAAPTGPVPLATGGGVQPVPLATGGGVRPGPSPSSTLPAGDRIKGKVVDTMNARGYTYVAVETSPGNMVWAAGPEAPVKIGQPLDLEKGHVMTNFKSPSLGRTFGTIYFVGSLGVHGGPKQGATSRPSSAPTSRPTSPGKSSKAAMPAAEPVSVPKVDGGHTVAEVFAQADTLGGKEVTVRGQVVKFSSGIMGKNWIHIQDGTGDASQKTHDLTVTTDGTAAVGDTILIKGTLTRDKDFGAGYRYPVIVENAVISK